MDQTEAKVGQTEAEVGQTETEVVQTEAEVALKVPNWVVEDHGGPRRFSRQDRPNRNVRFEW